VRLAGALLSDADVLLLDEPSNHLDAPAREALLAMIRDRAGAVIVASHDRIGHRPRVPIDGEPRRSNGVVHGTGRAAPRVATRWQPSGAGRRWRRKRSRHVACWPRKRQLASRFPPALVLPTTRSCNGIRPECSSGRWPRSLPRRA
jgi:hypothetical protein